MLGLFGNDDQSPSPEQVNQHESELKSTARNTNSTGMMVLDTVSGTTIGLRTVLNRLWMVGKRYLLSSASTCRVKSPAIDIDSS